MRPFHRPAGAGAAVVSPLFRARAEVTLIINHSPMVRSVERRCFDGHRQRLLVGAATDCDWVLPGPCVAAHLFRLDWDGVQLRARSLGAGKRREFVVRADDDIYFETVALHLELIEVETQARLGRPARQVDEGASGATAIELNPAPTRLVSAPTIPLVPPRWSAWMAATLLPLTVLLARDVCLPAARPEAVSSSVSGAPVPRATTPAKEVTPEATMATARETPHVECAHASGEHARPEDLQIFDLAIESYRHGKRLQAYTLFQSLICCPEVGEAAQFMTRLVTSDGPAALPRQRSARVVRLLDESARELAAHGELWSQRESLASASLYNPRLSPYDFRNQPKCNIFIGEMLFRAGFIAPGTADESQRPVPFPSVNQMVESALVLASTGSWDPDDGKQWFDVVPRGQAEPGDLVLIAAKDRGDGLATEHGHVEVISGVTLRDGLVAQVSTVGARSAGLTSSPTAGRMFGGKPADGPGALSDSVVIVRPRMQ